MCGLSHLHVLGLVGIALNSSNFPRLILPFMENGDLKTYLKKTRKVGVVGSCTLGSEHLPWPGLQFRNCLSSELYLCITLSMAVFLRNNSEPIYIVVYK